MAAVAEGFEYVVRHDDVHIFHWRRPVTILRGEAARRFLVGVENGEPQSVMARATGNYERGNEREARNHPRNRGR